MKQILFFLSMALGIFFSQVAVGQISGTAHDFSGETWNTTGEICIVCHTPHNANTTVADAPLWNHELSTVDPYVLYSSSTFNGSATIGQPNGNSKLCLSCHDGTVALENFGGMTTGTNYISGGSNIGGPTGDDLSDDHPISFIYNTALANDDGELEDPATASSGLGGTIDDDMLFSGTLQCASCHDVHGTGNDHLLLLSNAASALCLTCHIK